MRADSHEKAKTTELGDSQLSVDTCQLKMWGKDTVTVYTPITKPIFHARFKQI